MSLTKESMFMIFVAFLLFCWSHQDDYSSCLASYSEQGGAPGVVESPNWDLPTDAAVTWKGDCQSASIQGKRRYQEDRLFCALNIPFFFPGRTGTNEVTVGMVAIFDGHAGAEASEMASKLLLKFFLLNTHFLIHEMHSSASGEERDEHDVTIGRWMTPEVYGDSHHFKVLKESLLRTITDIDETFTKEAISKNLNSGSTATIVLIVDGQILVANVGDSKALLCSENIQSSKQLIEEMDNPSNGSSHYFVTELTRDHHPDREDERSRVEAAGGFVSRWGGVSRVNGRLAVSRAIGDLSFKRYGVISRAEVTDWRRLTTNDHYLVVTCDGVFEHLVTQDVCDLIWDVQEKGSGSLKWCPLSQNSLAECIINAAFDSGSMDNLSAIVIPMRIINSGGSSEGSCEL